MAEAGQVQDSVVADPLRELAKLERLIDEANVYEDRSMVLADGDKKSASTSGLNDNKMLNALLDKPITFGKVSVDEDDDDGSGEKDKDDEKSEKRSNVESDDDGDDEDDGEMSGEEKSASDKEMVEDEEEPDEEEMEEEKLQESDKKGKAPMKRPRANPALSAKGSDGKKKKKTRSGFRRNIKKVLTEKQLEEQTLAARKEEEERQARQRQRQMQLSQSQLKTQLDNFFNIAEVIGERAARNDEVLLLSSDDERDDKAKCSFSSQTEPRQRHVVNHEGAAEVIELSSGDEDMPDNHFLPTSSFCNNSQNNFSGYSMTMDMPGEYNRFGQFDRFGQNERFGQEDDDIMFVGEHQNEANFEDTNNAGLHADDTMNIKDADGRVLVNTGHPPEDPDIYLPMQLAEAAKPHQIGGIRFLYDNLVESMERFKNSSGLGCILSHSMGLGKTMQVIAFIDVFLTHITAKYVLCIVPINTLQNWVNEFNYWLPEETEDIRKAVKKSQQNGHSNDSPDQFKFRKFKLYTLNESKKTMLSRSKEIMLWRKNGGVLLMGYEMYRILVSENKKKSTKEDEIDPKKLDDINAAVKEALIDPGPDLIVCDEGHRIKNCQATTSQVLKNIKTKRRIVMTGYPLQNNLMEYWCMVDFVRPNYLGSQKEFINMFANPIQNGQCLDSTPADRKLMRYRAHVLHSLLTGFVQRRSHSILKHTLPQKAEHVILCRMTPIQKALMQAFLAAVIQDPSVCSSTGRVNPIYLFSVCCKIWNHPDVVYNLVQEGRVPDDLDIDEIQSRKKGNKKGNKTNDNMLLDGFFHTDLSRSPSGSSSSFCMPPYQSTSCSTSSSSKDKPQIDYSWARPVLENYTPGDIENSMKTVLLFEIIDNVIKAGDRLLIFSQSLFTLDLLEKFLGQRCVPDTTDYWIKNLNYYRLDGSTSTQDRDKYIKLFNTSETAFLFLLSTRAGSLGINLTGANRIVVLDASWNPCHDAQAACRIYRYGQMKPCYIYRLICDNSLEKKIYDRQVNKQGVANRVVDEHNIEANFTWREINALLEDLHEICEPAIQIFNEDQLVRYSDELIKDICRKMNNCITRAPFEHESLLLDRKETSLTPSEKKLAEDLYIMAKQQKHLEASGMPQRGAIHSIIGPSSRPASSYASSSYGINMPMYMHQPPQPQLPTQMTPSPSFIPLFNPPPYSQPLPANPPARHNEYPYFEAIATSMVQNGNIVKKVIMPSDYKVDVPEGGTITVRQGEEVMIIQTPKGLYLRTNQGNIIAVKSQINNQNSTNGTSFGIVQPNLQCGGTVHFGPKMTSSTASQPPEVVQISDDEDMPSPGPAPESEQLGQQPGNSCSSSGSSPSGNHHTAIDPNQVFDSITINDNNNPTDPMAMPQVNSPMLGHGSGDFPLTDCPPSDYPMPELFDF